MKEASIAVIAWVLLTGYIFAILTGAHKIVAFDIAAMVTGVFGLLCLLDGSRNG